MIRFALRCTHGHAFESWFQSGAAYDGLRARGLVVCPECGSTEVEKALMAPAVASAPETAAPAPRAEIAARLRRLREEVEANSDYVGPRFAQEARAMYLGEIPDRAIYGEARPDEAKALIEDGVPVLPLPFTPKAKVN